MLGTNNDFASLNLFTYCGNNPTNRIDNGGCFWNIAAGAIIGGTISVISQLATNRAFKEDGSVLLALATGAISGAFAASGIPVGGQAIANAVISGIGEAVNQFSIYLEDKEVFRWEKAFLAVGIAAGLGYTAGYIGGSGTRTPGSAYRSALDNLDNVATRIATDVYSSATTVAKVYARAQSKALAIGLSTTVSTAVRFSAGTVVVQNGMAIVGRYMDMV